MNQEQALIDVFGNTLAANPSALRECLNLLRIYRIEPETLHSKWEAYIMNSTSANRDEDDDVSMTTAHLEGFKNSLRRTLELKSQQGYQQQAQSTSGSSFATPKRAQLKSRFQGSASQAPRVHHDMEMDHHDQYNSPESMSSTRMPTSPYKSLVQPSPSSKQFALRRNMSETEEVLNKDLKLRSEAPRTVSEYRNVINLVVAVKPYRYMFEKIKDKGEALDDRIEAFAELYRKSYPDTEFLNPAYPSQSVVTVVGRICSDANEGKANEQSLLLETSRSLGGGARVKLDVMEVQGYNFFPGQIVVLSGLNSHGSVFAVTRVHELPSLPMADASPADLEDFQYRKMAGQPIKMIVAAGPYTLSDNLLFEPFAALMEHVNTERPDVLLLMGPFISSTHPLIASGDVDMMPEAYFAKHISALLAKHQERYPKEMHILMVPSLQDVIHETLVMPQPEFEHRRSLALPAGTYCLPNPAQFTINEMVFAVNTADILMHLNGDEITRNPERTDRMSRLSKYIIDQRNMHPVYPGLASEPDCGVDFNQIDLMDLKVCPDVVIVPSKLKHFAKIVDNVVVVNPNQLSKMQAGGTFAKLTIHPLPENALSDAVMMMDEDDEQTMSTYHRVYERCRVDIVRV
ncbi:DNA-directed DNA polymerase alpha subunit pol12 [Linnemannia exigua]|uniref:DNA polymerase alpha subunit B n=1 Tax=Linnemannia exigua TaxID=604196 RepID=A0AAD4DI86_9FUNG|nr:DNA-directed DNA polymerase alpha subunit pol12 [Linnemannia exigua]